CRAGAQWMVTPRSSARSHQSMSCTCPAGTPQRSRCAPMPRPTKNWVPLRANAWMVSMSRWSKWSCEITTASMFFKSDSQRRRVQARRADELEGRSALRQHRIGQHPHAVDFQQHGCVAEPPRAQPGRYGPSQLARPDAHHRNFELRLAHFVAEVGLQLAPEGQIADVGRRVLEPAAVELLRRPHALQHDGAGAAAKHRQLKRCPCDAREYRADRQQRQDYSRWPIHAGSGKRTARIVLIWRRTRSAQMSL